MVSIRTKIAFACFVLVGGLLSGTASAQVSIDQGDDEVTTADAAAKLLQPVDEEGNAQLVEDLAANGVEGADESGAAEVSEGPDPFAAEGGPLTLMNCSGGSIRVKTYNSNDAVLWVPYKEFSIADGASTQLKCATSSCKVKVGSGGATGAMSGYQVFTSDGVRATNADAMDVGCSIYQ